MDITIPDDMYEKLTLRALAEGFADAASLIESLAETPTDDPRGQISPDELRASIEGLRRADAAIDAGLGIDADEAMRRIADKHGFAVNE